MSESEDNLLAGLRRSTDPADRRLADLLGGLVAPAQRRVAGPRASETLAAFLAANDPIAAAPLDTVPEPAAPDLVVELGRRPSRRAPMRTYLVPLRTLLRTSLLAKVVLGTTVALTGAGAVAATTGADMGSETVTVVPASDPGGSGDHGDETTGVLEVDDDHEGAAHDGDADDGPDPDDADEPDGVDDTDAQDDDEQGDDQQGDDDGAEDEGSDDQGDDESDDEDSDRESGDDESGDDESGGHEDSDHESGDDESGDHEDADHDSGDDESGDDDSGDDESGDEAGQGDDSSEDSESGSDD